MGGFRVTGVLISTFALSLAMIASSVPAAAFHQPFFHAAFFAQSAYPTLAPGQTDQLAAVYVNTGSETWIKGTPSFEARMATDAPNDNTVYFSKGWGPTWFAPNRFARQDQATVPPDTLGSWTWSITIPLTEPDGDNRLFGHEIIEQRAPGPFNASPTATYYEMEDFGFFLDVFVRACTPPATTQPCPSG